VVNVIPPELAIEWVQVVVMLRHGGGSLLLGRDDHGEASALLRAVAGIRIADIPHGNLHVRKGANKRHQMGEDLNRIMLEVTEA